MPATAKNCGLLDLLAPCWEWFKTAEKALTLYILSPLPSLSADSRSQESLRTAGSNSFSKIMAIIHKSYFGKVISFYLFILFTSKTTETFFELS